MLVAVEAAVLVDIVEASKLATILGILALVPLVEAVAVTRLWLIMLL